MKWAHFIYLARRDCNNGTSNIHLFVCEIKNLIYIKYLYIHIFMKSVDYYVEFSWQRVITIIFDNFQEILFLNYLKL